MAWAVPGSGTTNGGRHPPPPEPGAAAAGRCVSASRGDDASTGPVEGTAVAGGVAVGAGAGRNGVALVAQLFECRVAAGGSGRSRFPLGADDVAGGGGSAAGATGGAGRMDAGAAPLVGTGGRRAPALGVGVSPVCTGASRDGAGSEIEAASSCALSGGSRPEPPGVALAFAAGGVRGFAFSGRERWGVPCSRAGGDQGESVAAREGLRPDGGAPSLARREGR